MQDSTVIAAAGLGTVAGIVLATLASLALSGFLATFALDHFGIVDGINTSNFLGTTAAYWTLRKIFSSKG